MNIKRLQLILSTNKQKVKNYLKKGNQPYGVAILWTKKNN